MGIIPETKAGVVNEMDTLGVPDFMDLESLLNESLTQQAERVKEKEIRQKVKLNRIADPNELEESRKLLRKWDNQREWMRSANVLCFNRQKCKCCGKFQVTLEGYFERYTNRRLSNTTKQERVKAFELPNLPKDVIYHDSLIEICHFCADDQEWPLQEL